MSAIDREVADKCLKFLAIFSQGLLTGNALFVTAVGHPAMLALPSMEITARCWNEQFHRTKNLQMKLSVLTTIGSFGTFALNKYHGTPVNPLWLISGIMVNAVLPYTLIVMMPINNMLCKQDAIVKEKGDTWVKKTITTWGSMHAVRTAVNVVAYGMMCYATFF